MLLLLWAGEAAAQVAAVQVEAIGFIKTVDGEAFIQRKGERVAASVGGPLYRADICETGEAGTLGMTFKDNMVLSLGPLTRLKLESFEFEPVEHKLGFVGELTRGTMQYISGLIAKLSPESVTVKTPVANIAVRGTRFLVRIDD